MLTTGYRVWTESGPGSETEQLQSIPLYTFDITDATRMNHSLNLTNVDQIAIHFLAQDINQVYVVNLYINDDNIFSLSRFVQKEGDVVIPVDLLGFDPQVLRAVKMSITLNGNPLPDHIHVRTEGRQNADPRIDTPKAPSSPLREVGWPSTPHASTQGEQGEIVSKPGGIIALLKGMGLLSLIGTVLGLSLLTPAPLKSESLPEVVQQAHWAAHSHWSPHSDALILAFMAVALLAFMMAHRSTQNAILTTTGDQLRKADLALGDIVINVQRIFNADLIEIPLSLGARARYKEQMINLGATAMLRAA
jgi:hypothetical protein